jgi:Indole-3-glycerol phosphate synthase
MFLDRIVASKRQEVEALKQRAGAADFEKIIAGLGPCKGFERALTAHKRRSVGLIAEIKKASPSKGLIRADFHPVELARAYAAAGADCLSVLTDEPFFQGANAYLQDVRSAVDLPILRKDFTLDPIQVYEARAIGADAILLIAAILDDWRMRELYRLAKDLGMDVLIEVHDEEELERALALQPTLIGINNRNLKTFVTDLAVTERLIGRMPKEAAVVSESGISKPEDISLLRSMGVQVVLVGEHFMRQPDVEAAVHRLMGPVAARHEDKAGRPT